MENVEQGRWIDITSPTSGNFRVQHGLGRAPRDAHLEMTCLSIIVWQPRMFDDTYLYLLAAAKGVTAQGISVQ